MAATQGLISPFEPAQIKRNGNDRLVSYGTSSYGYDVRCSDRFKIFTNINSAVVDPKNFDENSFVDFQGGCLHHPPQLLRPSQHHRAFQNPPQCVDGVPGQIHLRPLRHHRQCDASGAGMGRPM